jgi:hypothetical protein
VKIAGLWFGEKTIDEVLEVFTKAESDLREIASDKQDDATEARDEAERQTQLANLYSGEAGRARSIADRIKLMLGGPTEQEGLKHA